jgi:hypothetical protein
VAEASVILCRPPSTKDMNLETKEPRKNKLFGSYEQDNDGPSEEEDEKDEKLFYQFGVHMISF